MVEVVIAALSWGCVGFGWGRGKWGNVEAGCLDVQHLVVMVMLAVSMSMMMVLNDARLEKVFCNGVAPLCVTFGGACVG